LVGLLLCRSAPNTHTYFTIWQIVESVFHMSVSWFKVETIRKAEN